MHLHTFCATLLLACSARAADDYAAKTFTGAQGVLGLSHSDT